MYKQYIKRLLDIVISAIALLLVGWLLLFVALLLLFANKGAGVFFLQERPGKDGKIFRIEQVIDMHESQAAYSSVRRDKYTVKICGQQCSLYFERTRLPHGMQVGRWYVERKILTPLKKTA